MKTALDNDPIAGRVPAEPRRHGRNISVSREPFPCIRSHPVESVVVAAVQRSQDHLGTNVSANSRESHASFQESGNGIRWRNESAGSENIRHGNKLKAAPNKL